MTITLSGVTITGGYGIYAEPPTGQVAYTTSGTYSWVAPDGVNSVCVVCVGGGGAVRIIWGPGRAFPSTNTGDM